jgi:hypothetical protein
MRWILVAATILAAAACNTRQHKVAVATPVTGKWQLVTVTKNPLEKVVPSSIMTGFMALNADGTCEAELAWPDKPTVRPATFSGTYKLEGDQLHITNNENGNLAKSTWRFQGEYLVVKAAGENTYHYYYKPAGS